MGKTKSLVKIKFPLSQDDTSYPEISEESLWARPCGNGIYEIDNIPFFVKRVSCGDKVLARPNNEGVLYYQKHVSFSKHSTYRLVIFDQQKVPLVRDELEKMGCSSELSHVSKLIAVDVPPEVAVSKVVQYFKVGEESGDLEYEEASIWD